MGDILHFTIVFMEGVGGLIIFGAAIFAIYDLFSCWYRKGIRENVEPLRLQFCRRLVLALEFLIAADILATLHTPTTEDIALLAAIIVVRTVLSISITYELRQA
tara:strand:+ start:850 stop:1161 length:312 start_codon:yes stop_codon:yes gene_type:complete